MSEIFLLSSTHPTVQSMPHAAFQLLKVVLPDTKAESGRTEVRVQGLAPTQNAREMLLG